MLKRLISLSTILLMSYGAFAQTQVVTGVMNGKDYGVAYSLPKTQLKATIHFENTTYTPGEFAKYANRFLHLNNVEQASSNSWRLKQVEIGTIGVPDPEKSYFVKLKDKTVAPNLTLTQSGVIQSINTPLIKKSETTSAQQIVEQEQSVDPRKYFTEEILLANSTAKVAELVAKEIYAIRESRNSLLRGEYDDIPADGEFLKIMLKKMDEQENALLSLFVGKTDIVQQRKDIIITPEEEITDHVIARFSTKVGVVESDNLIGEPIYISLKDLKTVNIIDDGKGKKKQEGIAYNLPGRGYIQVIYQNHVISKGEFPITQFGTVEFLAPALFNKKSTIQVYFDPTTGGLLKVNQEEQ